MLLRGVGKGAGDSSPSGTMAPSLCRRFKSSGSRKIIASTISATACSIYRQILY